MSLPLPLKVATGQPQRVLHNTLAIVANHSAFLLPQTKAAAAGRLTRLTGDEFTLTEKSRQTGKVFCCITYCLSLAKMSKKQAPLSNYFGVPPPPPPKRRQTEPPPEQHRKRVFNEKWLDNVGWLATNDERSEMWCKICRERPSLADKKKATFYVGTKRKHEISKEHVNI